MSFDFKDRHKLDDIHKLVERLNDSMHQPEPSEPFKHLDALAEKVKYDIANRKMWADLESDRVITHREYQQCVASILDQLLTYINEIKEANS